MQNKKALFTFTIFLTLISFVGISQEPVVSENKTSLFNFIYELEGIPKIIIDTDVNKLITKKMKEEYQKTSFTIIAKDNHFFHFKGKIRARGNTRKKVSFFPPVKVNLKKSVLDSLGFLSLDKLKFVFPKDKTTKSQKRLLKEFLLYELYDHIDSSSIRVKLVDVHILNKGKNKYRFTGFMIEDEEEYARRNDAIILEKGIPRYSALDRESFLKMVFFQYMIANTDYFVSNKHNLKIVKLPHIKKAVAIPYDFDYSGFVGQDYAQPYIYFPITNVHERYLHTDYRLSESEFDQMIKYFLSIQTQLYSKCDNASYMDTKLINENKKYLARFYKLFKKPKKLKLKLVKK